MTGLPVPRRTHAGTADMQSVHNPNQSMRSEWLVVAYCPLIERGSPGRQCQSCLRGIAARDQQIKIKALVKDGNISSEEWTCLVIQFQMTPITVVTEWNMRCTVSSLHLSHMCGDS